MNRIYLLIVMIIFVCLSNLQAQDVNKELEEKRKELEKKAVEILDLRSALIIQQAELNQLRKELEKLRIQNEILNDSLRRKESKIKNLEELLKTVKEDKELSTAIIRNIRSSADTLSEEKSIVDSVLTDEEYISIYNNALSMYFNKEYRASMDKFEYLVVANSKHPLADNAQYWLGECYYSMERYQDAIEAFQRVLDLGDGNKSDAAIFKIGLSYLKLGNKIKAHEIFVDLEKRYPDSELVEKAKEYMKLDTSF
ncbi:MAG: tetratricopeptide repeat protein [Candidatus Marinimicrobia bacterium]|nr:tetratricopeptide repeat protein [Candidatus Neomarinimicrobiota bacterium]